MKILIVIDMQKKYMHLYDTGLVPRVNEKISEAAANGTPIIYINNRGKKDSADEYALAKGLKIASDNIFIKDFL